jgi:hypothetical protein
LERLSLTQYKTPRSSLPETGFMDALRELCRLEDKSKSDAIRKLVMEALAVRKARKQKKGGA